MFGQTSNSLLLRKDFSALSTFISGSCLNNGVCADESYKQITEQEIMYTKKVRVQWWNGGDLESQLNTPAPFSHGKTSADVGYLRFRHVVDTRKHSFLSLQKMRTVLQLFVSALSLFTTPYYILWNV